MNRKLCAAVALLYLLVTPAAGAWTNNQILENARDRGRLTATVFAGVKAGAFSVDFADPLNSTFKKADPFSASATLRIVRNIFVSAVSLFTWKLRKKIVVEI